MELKALQVRKNGGQFASALSSSEALELCVVRWAVSKTQIFADECRSDLVFIREICGLGRSGMQLVSGVLLPRQPEIAWIEPVELHVRTLNSFQVRLVCGHLLLWSNHEKVPARDVFALHAVAWKDTLMNFIFPLIQLSGQVRYFSRLQNRPPETRHHFGCHSICHV